VAPIDEDGDENLIQFWRDGDSDRFMRRVIASCRFVPMLGAEGFSR
jgi:hypothetical protein